MRIHNLQTHKILEQGLYTTLTILRSKRKFNPNKYISSKCALLNKYMRDFHLSSCVVAVSGGIDSAVTLGIVRKAAMFNNSPIRKIVVVLMPVFSKEGATNQKSALALGKKVAKIFSIEPVIIDLTKNHALMKNIVDKALAIKGKSWASGQLVSYIRTPALYYVTSLLTQSNLPAILCGTTNRDEGAYLGYFGKASDGMVDIQIISDIHKSEVYKVAKMLGIPRNILSSIPSGDMFDGRSDEEVFGATYDFVELYMLQLCLNKNQRKHLEKKWNKKEKEQFYILSQRLEKLHNYNKHKYLGKSSSIHLDVYKRTVPGGWS